MPRHKTTAARRAANDKYIKKQDQIILRMPAADGLRATIQERAAALGVSVNAYIIGLINNDLAQADVSND